MKRQPAAGTRVSHGSAVWLRTAAFAPVCVRHAILQCVRALKPGRSKCGEGLAAAPARARRSRDLRRRRRGCIANAA